MFNVEVGEFELKSTVARITDPCYDKDTWCAGTVDNVLPGTWTSSIVKFTHEETDWGERVGELIAQHKDYDIKDVDWESVNIDVGVDSGQAGIFDDSQFKNPMSTPHKMTGGVEYNLKCFSRDQEKDAEIVGKFLEEQGKNMSSSLHVRMTCVLLDMIENNRKFKDDLVNQAKEETEFYEVCCDKTLSDIGAGTVEYGVVSRSGFGDGGYNAYVARNSKNKVVAIKIIYITQSELEPEEQEA